MLPGSGLPRDVDKIIVCLTPESLPSLSQISRSSRQATSHQYSSQLCTRPISLSEAKKYLKNSPKKFVIYHQKQLNLDIFDGTSLAATRYVIQADYSGSPNILTDELGILNIDNKKKRTFNLRSRGIVNIISTISLTPRYEANSEKYQFDHGMEKINAELAADNIELDFVSQYQILQQRAGCVSRNPHFAKNIIIAKITALCDNLVTIDSTNAAKVLGSFFRLSCEFALITGLKSRIGDYGFSITSDNEIIAINEYQNPQNINNFTPVVYDMGTRLIKHFETEL